MADEREWACTRASRVVAAIVALAPALAAAGEPQGPPGRWTLLTEPVRVEATVLDSPPAPPGATASFAFDLAVTDAATTQRIRTFLIAVRDVEDAVRVLRAGVAWRAPYLFVRSECGGGNAWGCDKEFVFQVAAGRARRVGAFIVGEEPRAAPQSLADGRFLDWYDKLEMAPIGLSHARSPGFRLVLAVQDRHLAVDPDRTWAASVARYRENDAALSAWLAGTSGAEEKVLAEAIVNAVLARYCGRDRELAELLARVTPRLGEEGRGSLRAALDLTVPLELPSAWRAPE